MDKNIPDSQIFNNFFNGLKIVKTTEGCSSNVHPLSGKGASSQLSLSVPEYSGSGITFSSIKDKLGRTLKSLGHVHNDMILNVLACLPKLHGSTGVTPACFLNSLFSNLKSVKVKQVHFVSADLPDGFNDFKVGEFSVGRLNREKFLYSLNKSKTSLPSHIEPLFSYKAFVVERETVVKIIPFNNLVSSKSSVYIEEVMFTYFAEMAELEMVRFWDEFNSMQLAYYPFGGKVFDASVFQSNPNAMDVTLFNDVIDSKGYLYCGARIAKLDLAGIDKFYSTSKSLLSVCGVDEGWISDKRFTVLKASADFFRTASTHKGNGRDTDALLHYIIILEMLFGDRSDLEKVISTRAAVIASVKLGFPVVDAFKRVRSFYSARSKFVHGGIRYDGDDLDFLEKLCRLALFSGLIAVSSRGPDGEMDLWRYALDGIYISLRLDITPDEQLLVRAGLR